MHQSMAVFRSARDRIASSSSAAPSFELAGSAHAKHNWNRYAPGLWRSNFLREWQALSRRGAKLRLRPRAKPVLQLPQRHQVDGSKGCPVVGHKSERVRRGKVRECHGNRAKPSVVAGIDDAVLAPMLADQVEPATTIRMERRCDAHPAAGRILTTCSR